MPSILEKKAAEPCTEDEDGEESNAPILNLTWKTTIRRVLHARMTSQGEETNLTARGRRVRARRTREGLPTDVASLNEEGDIGRRGEG